MELWCPQPRQTPKAPCVSDQRGPRQRPDGLTWTSLGADAWSFGPRSRAKQREISNQQSMIARINSKPSESPKRTSAKDASPSASPRPADFAPNISTIISSFFFPDFLFCLFPCDKHLVFPLFLSPYFLTFLYLAFSFFYAASNSPNITSSSSPTHSPFPPASHYQLLIVTLLNSEVTLLKSEMTSLIPPPIGDLQEPSKDLIEP